MLRHRAVGDSEAPEQDSNIVYGFHLIPIYNRAQFVDKTDPCRSMSRRQGRVRTGAAMECHMERHKDSALAPLLWLLLALCMLACAHPGYAVPGGYIIDYAASQY